MSTPVQATFAIALLAMVVGCGGKQSVMTTEDGEQVTV
ncbi:hypothetical protein TBK1r_54200 [Stieleria magnilauensis]|uniref:Uncharacterized protein n=2 Tax=Stieleria TaxID=2795973 RepID=A0ABX5Y0G0_9BACT|nr:hypothetical protein TBK1r_54200 [Planctomycetes bacterium TBK1r]